MSNHNASAGTAVRASPDMLKLRLIASLIEATRADEDDARDDALQKRYDEVSERILDRPVRSWADVAEIAEIAFFWADKDSDGELLALAGACGEDDRIAAELILAVLTMAKGGSMSDTDRRGFLRGGLKAALLGTGGVLLPMEGRSLFNFPNVAAIPDIPVIARGFSAARSTAQRCPLSDRRPVYEFTT